MATVIADTSPLQYLFQVGLVARIGADDWLSRSRGGRVVLGMMTSKTRGPKPPKLRARGQLRGMIAIVLGVMFTLASAAAQLMPGRPRPERRPIDDELAAIALQRKARIAQLEQQAPGERCHPPAAHELARLLVMDGRWTDVRQFADGYERRCGEDPIVRTWGNAPEPRARR